MCTVPATCRKEMAFVSPHSKSLGERDLAGLFGQVSPRPHSAGEAWPGIITNLASGPTPVHEGATSRARLGQSLTFSFLRVIH